MINLNIISKYLVLFTILFSFSCKDKFHEQVLKEQKKLQDNTNPTPEVITSKIKNNKFKVNLYDGCEYLIYKNQPPGNRAIGFMAHKGNCKNEIHKMIKNVV